jgi:hypothetical protein
MRISSLLNSFSSSSFLGKASPRVLPQLAVAISRASVDRLAFMPEVIVLQSFLQSCPGDFLQSLDSSRR